MNKEKNSGITLIPLIITIIVMVIIAGVAINIAFDGLIGKTQNSVELSQRESVREELKSFLAEYEIKRYTDSSIGTLENFLKEKDCKIIEQESTETELIVEFKGYKFKINKDTLQIIGEPTSTGGINEPKAPTFTTVANVPDISGFNESTTYYVAWDKDSINTSLYNINDTIAISEKIAIPQNWYDYTAGTNNWANIKTTGGGNDCYWVWIPRYAYKIPTRSSSAQTIEIAFLDGTGKEVNDVIDENKRTQIQQEGGFKTTNTPGNWVIHPAFTNEGNGGFGELTGIWVAKFEASSNTEFATNLESYGASNNGNNITDKVKIVPNVTSWRNIIVSNIFDVCRYMINSEGSLENTTNIDSHMMKNSEWGAVAYLSRSVYGKGSQVWNNPWAYDSTIYYSTITGRASKSNDSDAADKFLNGDSANNYETVTDAYNIGNGPQASTTGNVYGVYDMAGGAFEYVAGYLSKVLEENSTRRGYSQSLYYANPEYKDIYAGNNSTDTANYGLAANKAKYGDAIYETSTEGTGTKSWDLDSSGFPYSSEPVFLRGGHAFEGSSAGVFAFYRFSGLRYAFYSFRPVLVSPQ